MLNRVPLWPDCGELQERCMLCATVVRCVASHADTAHSCWISQRCSRSRDTVSCRQACHAMPCHAMRCLAAEAVREHLRRRNARLRLRRRGRQAPAVELVPAAAYMGMWVYGSIGNRHHPTPTPYNNNSNSGTSELAGLRSHSIGREVAVVPSIAPNESARSTRKAC